MKKWFAFIVSLFFCLCIWGYLIFLILVPKEFPSIEHTNFVINDREEFIIENEEVETKKQKEANEEKYFLENIKKRGIYKEDLAFIAPDGIITIDTLLEVLEIKEGWDY